MPKSESGPAVGILHLPCGARAKHGKMVRLHAASKTAFVNLRNVRMIPTTQTILHDPENGINGNCLSAVLASLLHVDIADVPVFCNEVSWVKDLNAWLRQFGLAYVQCQSFQEQCEASGIEGCYCEVFGDSPRRPGTLHATVGIDGVMVFDPHPDRTGVVGDQVCGLFVALQPWRMGREKAGGGE